ncbi:MAG: DUF3224 domain-containing protein [Acidobacteriaceae bacterium]
MRRIAAALACVGLVLALSEAAVVRVRAQNPAPGHREAARMHQATGSFEVKMAPQKADNPQAEGAGLGRMSLDKQYHGDLEAASQGEMLSVLDRQKGSGGYVAMERVTGKLQGRSGSFVLQHNATMNHGVPYLNIIVVPDTGTGELAGISGSMTIRIEGGQHFYDFEYAIDAGH